MKKHSKQAKDLHSWYHVGWGQREEPFCGSSLKPRLGAHCCYPRWVELAPLPPPPSAQRLRTAADPQLEPCPAQPQESSHWASSLLYLPVKCSKKECTRFLNNIADQIYMHMYMEESDRKPAGVKTDYKHPHPIFLLGILRFTETNRLVHRTENFCPYMNQERVLGSQKIINITII